MFNLEVFLFYTFCNDFKGEFYKCICLVRIYDIVFQNLKTKLELDLRLLLLLLLFFKQFVIIRNASFEIRNLP